MPNLYALLVGVSNYQRPVAKLPGCASDLHRMQEYLENEKKDFKEVHIRSMLDKESTKNNIVQAFREHLGQAKEGDVAMFYFTGHGTQEEAEPSIWRYESDRKLECLVCYDSVEEDSNVYLFLADKEIRWLIHELYQKTKSHVITVFDCCHSGENTRNVHVGEQASEVAEKRLVARFSGGFPKRAWSDFVFAKDITPDDLKTRPLHEVIPEGRHVQLAACRNDESAYEVSGGGVFTTNLLDVLSRSQGAVTYYDMRSRIKNFIKGQYMQTPQIYVQGGDLALGFTTFLGKSEEGRPLYGNVIKNKDLGWVIDMGALHGISKRGQLIEVETEKNEKLSASVVRVFPDTTAIRFEASDESKAEKAAELKGYVKDFQSAPIKVYLDAEDAYKGEAEKLKKELEAITNLHVTDKEYEAEYSVVIQKEGLNGFANRITYAGSEEKYYVDAKKEKHIRSLVLPATSLEETYPEKVTTSHLKHIAQWEYVKNLNNPNTFLFRSGFPLEVGMQIQNKDGEWEEVALENECLAPMLQEQSNGGLAALTNVRLRNAYNKKLYVSVMSLSLNFEAYPNFLNPPGYGLNPGEEKIIDTIYTPQGEFPLSLSCEPEVLAYNLPYSPAWLLFIASTQENVDVTTLELPPLPGPLTDRTRFIGAAKGEQDADANDWITRLVALKIQVPK